MDSNVRSASQQLVCPENCAMHSCLCSQAYSKRLRRLKEMHYSANERLIMVDAPVCVPNASAKRSVDTNSYDMLPR